MAHGASGFTTYEENTATDVHTFPGDRYIGWSDNQITEVSLPWSAIGDPTQVDFVVWAKWQDAGHVWTAFPPKSGHVERCGDLHAPVSLAGPERLDRPCFNGGSNRQRGRESGRCAQRGHRLPRHQPYYKNKLTGMYELPWVRVHAMTEYVDSPASSRNIPTREVTYNLVPSFLEQLTDYHRNETADVHTDFARRDWPTNADGTVAGYPNATALELHTMQFNPLEQRLDLQRL